MIYQIKKYGIENVLPSEMLESTELKDNEKAVFAQAILYSGMGEYIGKGKGHFFRSNSSFMNDCGLDSHSFRRAADGLVRKKLLKRRAGERNEDGSFASEYRIPIKYAEMNPLIMDGDFDEDFEIDVEERVVDEQVTIEDSEIDEAAPHIHTHIQNNNQNQIQSNIHKEKEDNKLVEGIGNNEAVGDLETPTAHIPFNEEKYNELVSRVVEGEIKEKDFFEQLASMGEPYFSRATKTVKETDLKTWVILNEKYFSPIRERYGWD